MTSTTKLFAVWGNGPAQSELIRNADHSDAAYQASTEHDPEWGIGDQAWFVMVEASEEDIDAATRFDPNVRRFAEVYTEAQAKDIHHDYERQCRRLVGPSWDTPLTPAEIEEIERPLTAREREQKEGEIEKEFDQE